MTGQASMALAGESVRIGIDIGGTFTDLQVLKERSGEVASLKTPTTPEDPSIGLMAGIAEAADRFGFRASDIRLLLHGTTIATNAVLERRLARGALLATEGFADVLEIGRHVRRDVYGLKPQREPALIPRHRRIGVAERLRADGSAETALTEDAIGAAIEALRTAEPETVAIALLHAHVNPAHERALRDAIAAALPGLPVSISSEISPEIREYERTSTVVLNALLVPTVRSYIDRLRARMAASGLGARLLLVQSNGGVCSPDVARDQPVRLLLSGPSGGARGAARAAARLGLPNLVGVDMGGTSFDVCVIAEGRVAAMTQGEIDGLPVRLPMIEIRTIGSGGGSIAAVDSGGRLTVGPRSAGARPGPVCYGRGGTLPTTTDANLVLGRLDPAFFLGGAHVLDRDGARAAIATHVGAPLGLSADAAAEGILTLTNASLAAAIRLSLFEKGLDPRAFAMLSFGGAGGLHAIAVAAELGIDRVVFPADASTFSANGILHSDIVHDLAASRLLPALPASLPAIGRALDDLRRDGAALLAQDGVPAEARDLAVSADLRYRGQAFELVVPWAEAAAEEDALERLVQGFHDLHRRRFSYANPEDPVEIVTVRLAARGKLPRAEERRSSAPPASATAMTRPMFDGGAWRDVAVHRRPDLAGPVAGPALIEEDYTTVLIPEGWTCAPAPGGELVARRDA